MQVQGPSACSVCAVATTVMLPASGNRFPGPWPHRNDRTQPTIHLSWKGFIEWLSEAVTEPAHKNFLLTEPVAGWSQTCSVSTHKPPTALVRGNQNTHSALLWFHFWPSSACRLQQLTSVLLKDATNGSSLTRSPLLVAHAKFTIEKLLSADESQTTLETVPLWCYSIPTPLLHSSAI